MSERPWVQEFATRLGMDPAEVEQRVKHLGDRLAHHPRCIRRVSTNGPCTCVILRKGGVR